MKHKIAAYLFLAIFLLHGGIISAQDNSREIARYEADVKKAPDDVEANMELIKAYFRAESGDKALNLYQNKLKENPASAQNHYFVGYVYMCQDKYDQAFGEFNNASRRGFKSKWLNHSLGMSYFFINEYQKAIKALAMFVKEDDTDAIAYGALASSEFHLKRYSESYKWAQKAIQIDPGNIIRTTAGLSLILTSRSKEAVVLLENGLSVNPEYLKDDLYIDALARAYIDSLRTGESQVNGTGILAAAKKHKELLANKVFAAIYAETRKVLPELPRSIRGITLGQSIADVDKTAKERKLTENIYSKTSSTYSDNRRLYDIRFSDPDYISLSVRLEENSVVELEATYNEKMGSYGEIIALAQKSLGAPAKSLEWKTDGQWPWHWRTVWMDDSTVIAISKMSETKDSTKSPEFTITNRAVYETEARQAKARQDNLEGTRGKKMFGGD